MFSVWKSPQIFTYQRLSTFFIKKIRHFLKIDKRIIISNDFLISPFHFYIILRVLLKMKRSVSNEEICFYLLHYLYYQA